MSNWLKYALWAVRTWHTFINNSAHRDFEDQPETRSAPDRSSVLINDHRKLVDAFERCLALSNWPESDSAKDNIKPKVPKRMYDSEDELNNSQSAKKARIGVTTSVNIPGYTGANIAASITLATRAASDNLPQRRAMALREQSDRVQYR